MSTKTARIGYTNFVHVFRSHNRPLFPEVKHAVETNVRVPRPRGDYAAAASL